MATRARVTPGAARRTLRNRGEGSGTVRAVTKDHRPHFPQSGVIPWRLKRGSLEVLLVTSSSGRRWVIPKGIIEKHLSPIASASREALEEAGVEGVVDPASLGSYSYEKWGGVCDVEVFAMEVSTVHPTWEESHRRRKWLPPEDAAERVRRPKLARLIRRFAAKRGKRC